MKISMTLIVLLGLLSLAADFKRVKVSWYDSKSECPNNPYPGCPMANRESIYKAEREGRLFAAAWNIPFGKKVEVQNPKNGKHVIVEITDRGPKKSLKRDLDLCKKAFSKIADTKQGVILAEMRVR